MSEDISEVKKDMGDDYNEKLSAIIQHIEEARYNTRNEGERHVKILRERLHSLFLKLSGKMIVKDMKEEIEQQQKLNMEINLTHSGVKFHRVNNWESYWRVDRPVFNRYMDLLENREMHLNYCMEKLGLTNVSKKKKKKIV